MEPMSFALPWHVTVRGAGHLEDKNLAARDHKRRIQREHEEAHARRLFWNTHPALLNSLLSNME